MARTLRQNTLKTRTNRLKLAPQGKPYFAPTGRKGVHIGYRRLSDANGTWVIRRYLGEQAYETERIAEADDYAEPDGASVLDYYQAMERAGSDRSALQKKAKHTVNDEIAKYLAGYRAGTRRSAAIRQTEIKLGVIAREFGDTLVTDLTTEQIEHWHARHAAGADDEEQKRKRQATANRMLAVLKAVLNHAWRKGRVRNDEAWRRVAKFKSVDPSDIRYLKKEEAKRLLNACQPDFRQLVRAALETGCRYSELTELRGKNYNSDAGTVTIPHPKGGKARHVPLSANGRELFAAATAGLKGDELVFTHSDRRAWAASHQQRPLSEACKVAKIVPAIGFHDLRHTYASLLAMNNTPMAVIAQALGHADQRMTERHYAALGPSYFEKTVRTKLPDFGAIKTNVRKLRP